MAVKSVVNKFGGPKSIIKLFSNNLMHNYMFSVVYKLGKMTSFAIFLFQLWAFTNDGLAYTCFELDLMQEAAFIKSYNVIRLLRKKRGYLTSVERKKDGRCKLSVSNMYKEGLLIILITFRLDLISIMVNIKRILLKL